MSQYRSSMLRMCGLSESEHASKSEELADLTPSGLKIVEVNDVIAEIASDTISALHQSHKATVPEYVVSLIEHSDFILKSLIPVLWSIILVVIMSRESFLENVHMPILGVFAACLANCVPIGGGIVYVPMLSLLGKQMNMSVSFTVATMTVGNGIFGFLHWLSVDPNIIIWESFEYTVIPCSLGSIVGILLLPPLDTLWVKKGFGLFCMLLAIYVFRASGREGDLTGASSQENWLVGYLGKASGSLSLESKWLVVAVVSFASGLVLVTNIGIGPALVTFFFLEGFLGYQTKRAIVTGIITGGWVSLVPFLVHLFILRDVPVELWVMVLPGVYLGAHFAPLVYEFIGIQRVFFMFGCFLVLSACMFLW